MLKLTCIVLDVHCLSFLCLVQVEALSQWFGVAAVLLHMLTEVSSLCLSHLNLNSLWMKKLLPVSCVLLVQVEKDGETLQASAVAAAPQVVSLGHR